MYALSVTDDRPGRALRAVPDIEIRAAGPADAGAVRRLFAGSLDTYYDGDHLAHAERVLRTHLGGGVDRHGHFSRRQHLIVCTVDGAVAGLVNLVFKRQGTVKASPIIVHPAHRGVLGIGTRLLEHARELAAGEGARLLYTTVTDSNAPMLSFLSRRGWVVAGHAVDQYRRGATELLMYESVPDRRAEAVRVEPMAADDRPAVRALVTELCGRDFAGVDASFADALVRAHERRHRAIVEEKFKVVHVARDADGTVVGVAAAGPKKGSSVKVSPLCATQPHVLDALVAALPRAFAGYGHKLYTHQPADPATTRVLQRHGWRIEGLLPEAYRTGACTAQWSLPLLPAAVAR